jgi:hypothetical protein
MSHGPIVKAQFVRWTDSVGRNVTWLLRGWTNRHDTFIVRVPVSHLFVIQSLYRNVLLTL